MMLKMTTPECGMKALDEDSTAINLKNSCMDFYLR